MKSMFQNSTRANVLCIVVLRAEERVVEHKIGTTNFLSSTSRAYPLKKDTLIMTFLQVKVETIDICSLLT